MSGIAKEIHNCRACGSEKLEPILSLGKLFVSDFLGDDEVDKGVKAPLELVLCNVANGGCGLLQLKHTVSDEALYRTYWYLSGTNKTMIDELRGIARVAKELVSLKRGDIVLDVGANDGTLLCGYETKGIVRVGFEPAKNLAKYNRKGTDKIFDDFFNYEAFNKEFGGAKAKIITAIAMFYDLDNPNKFVGDVVKCLDKNGIFIIQMSYLPLMLERNEIGNICHEHLEYYSLLSLENLLSRRNLEVFDVELREINGGSFRIYIKHKSGGESVKIKDGAEKRIEDLKRNEKMLGLDDKNVYDDFVKRIDLLRNKTSEFIVNEAAKGKKIFVYGASTKGNTLLQYYNLNYPLIGAAAERNPAKWGRYTVGTNIPIISEEEARKANPDYFLILPWHFLDEFVKREAGYLKNGGKFIVPMPELKII